MSNTALNKYVRFEWLVQPPCTIPCWRFSCSEPVLLRFKLHGPWDPESLYEWLLFTIHFVPLPRGRFPPQPVFALPRPYDSLAANGFTFIPYNEVHAGQDLVSFDTITVEPPFPGRYQLQVSAFVATERKVRNQLLGHILSHPIQIQTRRQEYDNVLREHHTPLPKCPCCDDSPCHCWSYCCHLYGCHFCQRCTPFWYLDPSSISALSVQQSRDMI
jgi:hypothetical protein